MTEVLTEKRSLLVPIGVVHILASEGMITEIQLLADDRKQAIKQKHELSDINARVLNIAAQQIEEYFSASRQMFSLPLRTQGRTPFSRQVYSCLEAIPFGEVRTYSELAVAAGHPKAARAVGQMMARNRFPLVLPCHRVLGKQGKMTGFSGGAGISTKEWLLEFERDSLAKKSFD